ncbi:MAG TPA: response regulator transcription factor [Galbitalea sp.]|nr:response regulator transcription factor [Galbitalea sp.]
MSEVIRVVVVDDQAIVREGLVTVLTLLPDVEVVGEAGDGSAGAELVDSLVPDVVLMDLRMPVMGGLEATGVITAAHPEIGVLILTTFADEASAMDVLRAGAKGFLTKDADRAEVATAIRAVAQGHTTLGAGIGSKLFAADARVGRKADLAARFNLTPREDEVLELIAEGLSNSEIAARLYVGVATVKTHINAIFAKLGVRDRAQAIALVHSS